MKILKPSTVLLLAILLLSSSVTPTYANDSILIIPDEALLLKNTAQFSATVPIFLPIMVNSDNKTTVATDVTIVNNSPAPIIVKNVDIISKGGWILTDTPSDRVGRKEINFKVSTQDITILSKSSAPIIYTANLSPQKSTIIEEPVLDIIFTLDWNDPEALYRISGKDLLLVEEKTHLSISGKEEQTITWKTDDPSIVRFVSPVSRATSVPELVSQNEVQIKGINIGTTKVTATDDLGNSFTKYISVTENFLHSIYVSVNPTKTIYAANDIFDPAGMIVTAVYINGDEFELPHYGYDQTPIVAGQNSIEISYTEKDITKTTKVLISVEEKPEIDAPLTPIIGTKYEDDTYEYSYGQSQTYDGLWTDVPDQNGWGVRLKDKNPVGSVPPPLGEILGAPVTNLSYLFSKSQISVLDLNDWDIPNVNSTSHMFSDCQITTLAFKNFNISGVTDMSGMFKNSKITILDLSQLDTSSVTTMREMFQDSQITILSLTNLNTLSVSDMTDMFRSSHMLSLDLSSFNLSTLIDADNMFTDCKASKGIARTDEDADRLNGTIGKPLGLIFVAK